MPWFFQMRPGVERHEALALGATAHVDVLANLELSHAQIHVAVRLSVDRAKFADFLLRLGTRLGEVAEFGFGDTLGLLRVETDLNGLVAVDLDGLTLEKHVVLGGDDSNRGQLASRIVDARHADLLTNDSDAHSRGRYL